MTQETAASVVAFWTDEIGETGWYAGGEALDAKIRDRFLPVWQAAHAGALDRWRDCPQGALAYILVTDQFSRNINRDTPDAFATDTRAVEAAKSALRRNWDLQTPEPLRQFFYLPLTHSESASDQERGVRLILTRMPETGAKTLLHARAHREVIRRYGRFPNRNLALGRANSRAEAAFLEAGGYGSVVRALQAA